MELKILACSKIVPSPALIVPSRALIVPLPVNRFLNKLAPNVSNNILRNSHFCSFASFLIVSLMPFINKPDYSRKLIIFMIPFISSFETISVVISSKKCDHLVHFCR